MPDFFVKGLLVHLLADWMLQSDWMSNNKVSLRHPAAWVHSGIHTLGFLLVFPPLGALFLGLSHLLIDTRLPLSYLRKIMGQKAEGPSGISFMIWQDQVAHILLIYVAAARL